jgi:YbgC/YbaW family acyl-CoA thioester hydrolase
MIDIPMRDLRDKVLVTRERVKFVDADPYGHLASSAYIGMIMSHRVEGLADRVGFSIMRYARAGVAFPARNVTISFVKSATVGEELEIGSWIAKMGSTSFEMRAVVTGARDRTLRALSAIHFVAVDAGTGRSIPVPTILPSSATTNPIPGLPDVSHYCGSIPGMPAHWLEPSGRVDAFSSVSIH